MKKIFKIVSTLITSLAMFSACTVNKIVEPTRTVTVEGSATITSPADIAIVEFTLLTSGWSAKQIVTDNNTISNRLIESVKGIGVNEADIISGTCSLSNPVQQYEARRSIIVTVRNIELLPAVIDCKSGSIKLKSVKFDLTDSASAYRRARTAAIQQAQDAAALLAGASGNKIGVAETITETNSEKSIDATGNVTTTSTVSVRYTIQ